ncbi:MAG TPA: MoaD/ThiS family protein [Chthoniobacterales bacterium]|nr:MoaD/ThiS family protein [Chthoniobacterales bacterium]
MKVRVQFFSHLKEIVGTAQMEEEITGDVSVRALLENLYARYPKLREWDKSILVGAGVEFVERDYALKAGDEIAIMPPVQGG